MNLRVASKRCNAKCNAEVAVCNQEAQMRVSNANCNRSTNANDMFQGEVQLRALVKVAYQR